MCLEGCLVAAVDKIPGGKYISGLLTLILIIWALFLAFQTGFIDCFVACYCPILYILYYYTMKHNN